MIGDSIKVRKKKGSHEKILIFDFFIVGALRLFIWYETLVQITFRKYNDILMMCNKRDS